MTLSLRRASNISLPALIAVIFVWAPAFASSYTVTDIGTFGGYVYPYDMNEYGDVVGYSHDLTEAGGSFGEQGAFVYRGSLHDLRNISEGLHTASGINDFGTIVGSVRPADGGLYGFIYDGVNVVRMGTLGGTYGGASGINNAGSVVGGSQTSDGEYHPYVYSEGRITDLGTLSNGDYGAAVDISNSGHIAGYSNTAKNSNAHHAFLYVDGVMHDLGMFEGRPTLPTAVNDKGWIVGRNTDYQGTEHAFLYDGSSMNRLQDLGGGISKALDLNDFGSAVGQSRHVDGAFVAALWEGNSVADLNDLIPSSSGWVLYGAEAINNRGQITGWGKLHGEWRGFLLTPIPEPTSFTAFAGVAFSTILRRRRVHH